MSFGAHATVLEGKRYRAYSGMHNSWTVINHQDRTSREVDGHITSVELYSWRDCRTASSHTRTSSFSKTVGAYWRCMRIPFMFKRSWIVMFRRGRRKHRCIRCFRRTFIAVLQSGYIRLSRCILADEKKVCGEWISEICCNRSVRVHKHVYCWIRRFGETLPQSHVIKAKLQKCQKIVGFRVPPQPWPTGVKTIQLICSIVCFFEQVLHMVASSLCFMQERRRRW